MLIAESGWSQENLAVILRDSEGTADVIHPSNRGLLAKLRIVQRPLQRQDSFR